MSEIGTNNSQQDIDKIVLDVLKGWEEYDFKDMSLWEIFQEDFLGFIKENFR